MRPVSITCGGGGSTGWLLRLPLNVTLFSSLFTHHRAEARDAGGETIFRAVFSDQPVMGKRDRAVGCCYVSAATLRAVVGDGRCELFLRDAEVARQLIEFRCKTDANQQRAG